MGCEVAVDEVSEGFLLPSSGIFFYLQYQTSGSGSHQTKSKRYQRECSEECLHSSYTALRVLKSLSLSFCVIIILYGCIWRSLCKILLTLLSESPRAAACLTTERLGDCWIDALIRATFSGVVMVKGRPNGFFLQCKTRCSKVGYPNEHCFSEQNHVGQVETGCKILTK